MTVPRTWEEAIASPTTAYVHEAFSPRQPNYVDATKLAIDIICNLVSVEEIEMRFRPLEESKWVVRHILGHCLFSGNESDSHVALKCAVVEWMRRRRYSGIRMEAPCPYGRADVSCERPVIFAEVGNTDIQRAEDGIFGIPNSTFLVVPYQGDAVHEGFRSTIKAYAFRATQAGIEDRRRTQCRQFDELRTRFAVPAPHHLPAKQEARQ